jgi:hypothetical protein
VDPVPVPLLFLVGKIRILEEKEKLRENPLHCHVFHYKLTLLHNPEDHNMYNLRKIGTIVHICPQ